MQGNYFLIVPAVPGVYQCDYLAKSRVVTISLSPQGRAYTRTLKSEKSLSLPIPVGEGVGGVDTKDLCINGCHCYDLIKSEATIIQKTYQSDVLP